MENLEKDHSYSESPQQPVVTTEEYAVPEVIVTRRLRDRELLRKRKAEAEEKETYQDQKKSKLSRKGKGTGRGRGRRQAPEPETQAEVPETHELPVITLEETAETTLTAETTQVEPSFPPEAEELYAPKEVAEATAAGGAACLVELEETPRSEEPEIPESLENDHLEQEFHGYF